MSSDPEYAQAAEFDADDLEPRPLRLPSRQRVLTVLAVLLCLAALIVVPPLISMNRYQKQIARSISRSLGRPVRIDSVALNLLPMPGFTLKTFVVGEDPVFGAEPVMRADTVHVTLRVRSLFGRHVEFSRISLEDPSINLVHLPDGRWNLESILIQAARMPAAPTGQTVKADIPRFPYIEATGARVNVKQGLDKLPLSLTDARISLWLDEPEQWRLRLEAKPTRTDAAPMETGLLRMEGTFGRASSLQMVPVDLTGEWSSAPLGAVSWITMGRDAGLRGDMRLAASFKGQVGAGALTTKLRFTGLRRADFVPEHALDVEVECSAQATDALHQLHNLACKGPEGLSAESEVPDVFHPSTGTGTLHLKNLPAGLVLDALHAASPSLSPDVKMDGLITGDIDLKGQGELAIAGASVSVGSATPILRGDLTVSVVDGMASIKDVPLDLGGADPALLSASATRAGYAFYLNGSVQPSQLEGLGAAIPLLANGLVQQMPGEDTATVVALSMKAAWGSPQPWQTIQVAPPAKRRTGSLQTKRVRD